MTGCAIDLEGRPRLHRRYVESVEVEVVTGVMSDEPVGWVADTRRARVPDGGDVSTRQPVRILSRVIVEGCQHDVKAL